jgi:hypothetical protein
MQTNRAQVIILALSEKQRQALEPLVRRQGSEHKALLFASIAPFFDCEAGQVRFRLQAVMLDWPSNKSRAENHSRGKIGKE